MANLFEHLADHYIAITIVFLGLFTLITFLFARDEFIMFIGGLFRIVGSLFYSPFIYLKRTVLGIADYGEKGEAELAQSKQYLLNKLQLTLQALLVVISIAILAAGVVSGWNQMMPPKSLTEAVSRTEDQLGKEKKELDAINQYLSPLEAAWSSQREALVAAYKAERTKMSDSAAVENPDIEVRVNALGGATQESLMQIKTYQTQNENVNYASRLQELKNAVTSYIARLGISDNEKALLRKYNENWCIMILSRLELSSLSESQLRSAIQPKYAEFHQNAEHLNETIANQERELSELKRQVQYNFKAFFLEILTTLLQFIILVWVVGVTIEAVWLVVHVANNVQGIREHLGSKS